MPDTPPARSSTACRRLAPRGSSGFPTLACARALRPLRYAYGRLAWGLGFLLKGLTEQFLAKGDVNTISMFVAVPHNKIVIPWYGSEVTSDGQYVWSNQHCWDTAVVATGWAFWTLTGVAMVFAGFLQASPPHPPFE